MATSSVMFDVAGWLNVLLAIAGLGVATLGLRTLRWWSFVLVGGFGLDLLASLAYRILPLLLRSGGGGGDVALLYLVPSVIGLIGQAAVVIGLAGCLLEPRSTPASPPRA